MKYIDIVFGSLIGAAIIGIATGELYVFWGGFIGGAAITFLVDFFFWTD